MKKLIVNDLEQAKQIFSKIKDVFDSILLYLKHFKKTLFITQFDRFCCKQIKSRLLTIQELLALITNLSERFKGSKSNENFNFYIDLVVRNSLAHIYKYNRDPFNYFPDVNLKLLSNGELIGVCSIKTHKVIWSDNELEIGDECGKIVYSNIKVNIFSNCWVFDYISLG